MHQLPEFIQSQQVEPVSGLQNSFPVHPTAPRLALPSIVIDHESSAAIGSPWSPRQVGSFGLLLLLLFSLVTALRETINSGLPLLPFALLLSQYCIVASLLSMGLLFLKAVADIVRELLHLQPQLTATLLGIRDDDGYALLSIHGLDNQLYRFQYVQPTRFMPLWATLVATLPTQPTIQVKYARNTGYIYSITCLDAPVFLAEAQVNGNGIDFRMNDERSVIKSALQIYSIHPLRAVELRSDERFALLIMLLVAGMLALNFNQLLYYQSSWARWLLLPLVGLPLGLAIARATLYRLKILRRFHKAVLAPLIFTSTILVNGGFGLLGYWLGLWWVIAGLILLFL